MGMIGNYLMVTPDVIEKILAEELSANEVLYDENNNEENFLDIDKSWHAIHFTLTGEIDEGDGEDPLSKVIFSGQLLGDEDVGFGPPMYLSVEEVEAANTALQNVSDEAFKARFDVTAMQENDIYPVTHDEDASDFLTYVMSYFSQVKDFFAKAAQNYKCIIFFIN